MIDAAYSRAIDRIVLVTDTGNAVHLVDPHTLDDVSIALPSVPASVSVAPNGTHAAIGHDGFISYVDLMEQAVTHTWNASAPFGDVALSNTYVYGFPSSNQWVSMHVVDVSTGVDAPVGNIYAGMQGAVNPDGTTLFGVDTELEPDSLYAFDLTNGAQPVQGNMYFGDEQPPCGALWISMDGSRLYTGCGYVFNANGLTYFGSLSASGQVVAGVDDWSADGTVAVLGGSVVSQMQEEEATGRLSSRSTSRSTSDYRPRCRFRRSPRRAARRRATAATCSTTPRAPRRSQSSMGTTRSRASRCSRSQSCTRKRWCARQASARRSTSEVRATASVGTPAAVSPEVASTSASIVVVGGVVGGQRNVIALAKHLASLSLSFPLAELVPGDAAQSSTDETPAHRPHSTLRRRVGGSVGRSSPAVPCARRSIVAAVGIASSRQGEGCDTSDDEKPDEERPDSPRGAGVRRRALGVGHRPRMPNGDGRRVDRASGFLEDRDRPALPIALMERAVASTLDGPPRVARNVTPCPEVDLHVVVLGVDPDDHDVGLGHERPDVAREFLGVGVVVGEDELCVEGSRIDDRSHGAFVGENLCVVANLEHARAGDARDQKEGRG